MVDSSWQVLIEAPYRSVFEIGDVIRLGIAEIDISVIDVFA